MWINVVVFFKKVWEILKRTPGWIILVLLSLVATVWWLLNRQLLLKKRLAVQKNIADIENEATRTRAHANATHSAEMDVAQDKYDEVKASLRAQEQQLNEAAAKGPVAIAEEWKKFLSKGR